MASTSFRQPSDRRRSWPSFKSRVLFVIRKRGGFLSVLLILLLAASVVVSLWPETKLWERFDTILTLITLGVAIAVFLGETDENWEEELPKRLTVIFEYDGLPRLVCHEAYLAHEGDVRNWAQQIGKQMCGGEWLDFTPFFHREAPTVELDLHHQPFKHYKAVFYLTNLPSKLSESQTDSSGGRIEKPCIVWSRSNSGKRVDSEPVEADRPERIGVTTK